MPFQRDLLAVSLVLVVSCGGEDMRPASGAGGSSGSATTGSSGSGAAGAAGGAGSASSSRDELTSGQTPIAELCSPSSYATTYLYGRHQLCNPGVGGLTPPSRFSLIESSELLTPMTPGQPYAVSIESTVSPGEWVQSVYGVMSHCAAQGEQADLLETKTLEENGPVAACSTLMPQKAYTHVLVLFELITEMGIRGSGGYQFCPGVSCPGQ